MVQENRLSKILVVCGPTASGKTSLAIDLALRYNGEVISADSVYIYKDLNVGSAKPDSDEMRGVRHHMINVIEAADEFSVSDYESQALPIVYDVISRGKLPVICGGTGFYVNSLLYKMSYGNAKGNESLRNEYKLKAEREGNMSLWEELNAIDPVTAKKLHYNDTVRVIRALEIYYSTGVKKSDVKDELVLRFDPFVIRTDIDRAELYERIDTRVDEMIKNGLIDEVKRLIDKGITLKNQCMQGIGYKETYSALINGETIPTDIIKQNSRRYAKRQITFFKRMNAYDFNPAERENYPELYRNIDEFLKN